MTVVEIIIILVSITLSIVFICFSIPIQPEFKKLKVDDGKDS